MCTVNGKGKGLAQLRLIPGLLLLACLIELAQANEPASPGLGTPMTAEQLEHLPSHVFADGQGLPVGRGTTQQGQQLYQTHCARCHGSLGQGGRALELVGDRALLASEYPDRGIAVFWPNAATLYEYIHRSMPPENPASFSVDELYSIIAYVLLLNDLIAEDAMVDADTLRNLPMPNRNGFITIGR